MQCLGYLKHNVQKRGLDLPILHGKSEEIIPSIAKALGVHGKHI
jgi:deoxyribodipyrimidine photo-lyase